MSDVQIQFSRSDPVFRLYDDLVTKEKISPSAMDQGVHEIDPVTRRRRLVGKDDRFLNREEVIQFALSEERFWPYVRKNPGYTISWALNDHDPATTFDQELEKLVDGAMALIRGVIRTVGGATDNEAADEMLALGLYAYVMADRKNERSNGKGEAKIPADAAKELNHNRLGRIVEWISRNGGLGVASAAKSGSRRQTVIEWLAGDRKGKGVDPAELIYAIFRRAGLKAEFVVGAPNAETRKRLGLEEGVVMTGVAVSLPTGRRLFGPGLKMADASPFFERECDWFYPQSEREHLSLYYHDLAQTFVEAGDHAKAFPLFEKALELDRRDVMALNNLGILYGMQGHFDSATTLFKRATEIRPDLSHSHYNLGLALAASQRWTQAVAPFEAAVDRSPDHLDARYNLALAYAMNRRWEKAIGQFREVHRRDPARKVLGQLSVAYGALLKELADTGSTDDLSRFKRLLDEAPRMDSSGELYLRVGEVLFLRNRLNEAVACYEKGVRLFSPTEKGYLATAWLGLWRSYEALGDTSNRLRACREYAKVSGESPTCK